MNTSALALSMVLGLLTMPDPHPKATLDSMGDTLEIGNHWGDSKNYLAWIGRHPLPDWVYFEQFPSRYEELKKERRDQAMLLYELYDHLTTANWLGRKSDKILRAEMEHVKRILGPWDYYKGRLPEVPVMPADPPAPWLPRIL